MHYSLMLFPLEGFGADIEEGPMLPTEEAATAQRDVFLGPLHYMSRQHRKAHLLLRLLQLQPRLVQLRLRHVTRSASSSGIGLLGLQAPPEQVNLAQQPSNLHSGRWLEVAVLFRPFALPCELLGF